MGTPIITNVDKCCACKYAFACDEQDEVNCKDRDYSGFELDSSYIKNKKPKEEYIKVKDIIEHAKEFKTYFDPMYRPVIDAFVYSLNNLPRKEM